MSRSLDPSFALRLQTALTGGLHIDPIADSHDTPIEGAIAHICSAQLRAIRCAMLMGDPDDGEQEEGRGWCTTDTFTRMDAVAAIGGVMALLQDSHAIAAEIRHSLKEDPAVEAGKRDLETLKQAAEQRQGGAS